MGSNGQKNEAKKGYNLVFLYIVTDDEKHVNPSQLKMQLLLR